MKKYHSSNQVPVLGLLLMLLAFLIGGIALGFLMHFIGKLFYLIVLFPAIAGGVGGFLLSKAIDIGKVRNKFVAIFFGILMGLLVYGSYHYFEFENFKNGVYESITLRLENSQNTELASMSKEELVDIVLVNETGTKGFWGFMKYSAKVGVSIGKVGRGSSGAITIKAPWVWGYYLFEIIIIAGVIVLMVVETASKPFCERCDSWYNDGLIVGYIPGTNSGSFLYALKSGNYDEAAASISRTKQMAPCLKIVQQHCPNCQNEDVYIKILEIVEKNGQNSETEKLKGMLTSEQYEKFVRPNNNRAI